mmetsp:Transcript_4983/g.11381  ORF Transcript_4983/g.11381 Transcript_4983/m.11381 type:complete len:264 (-) Transcript_4983:1404-2195(-)
MDPPSNDSVPKKPRVMQNTKRKFGRHVRRNVQRQPVPATAPVDNPAVPEDDVTQPISEIDVSSSLEPTNPYKKMRVGECRHNLVDRDDEIAQLKQALEASKQESLAKDAIIAERKECMHRMSQDLHGSRRECNLMLAEQREVNSRVAVAAEKQVVASRRDRDAVVAQTKDEAAAQVLLSINDHDSKVAEALLDKKRILKAERLYCQERRNETAAKLNSKIFTERVVHGDIVSKMEEQHQDTVASYEIEATNSKATSYNPRPEK